MLRIRKSKKAEADASGISLADLGLVELKMRPASPKPSLSRKKGTSSKDLLEEDEAFLLRSWATGKSLVVELGDSPPIYPSPHRSQQPPFTFGDSLM